MDNLMSKTHDTIGKISEMESLCFFPSHYFLLLPPPPSSEHAQSGPVHPLQDGGGLVQPGRQWERGVTTSH